MMSRMTLRTSQICNIKHIRDRREVAAARLRGQTGVKLFTDDVVQHFVGPEDVANIRESRPFVEYATRFIDDEARPF